MSYIGDESFYYVFAEIYRDADQKMAFNTLIFMTTFENINVPKYESDEFFFPRNIRKIEQ